MALTPEQQELLDKLNALPLLRYPRTVQRVAQEFGMSTQKMRNFLALLFKERLLTPRLDRRVLIQKTLDKTYLNVTEMVAAPLLTADEVREKRFFPGRAPRSFSAVALPREFAGNRLRFCSFTVPDNALGPLHIWERQVAVCAIGMLPRQGAPVLCILPRTEDDYVCVRCCAQIDDETYELYDPERLQVRYVSADDYSDHIIGPIVSTLRFLDTWRKPGEPMLKKEEK